jgi:hypothetical protein
MSVEKWPRVVTANAPYTQTMLHGPQYTRRPNRAAGVRDVLLAALRDGLSRNSPVFTKAGISEGGAGWDSGGVTIGELDASALGLPQISLTEDQKNLLRPIRTDVEDRRFVGSIGEVLAMLEQATGISSFYKGALIGAGVFFVLGGGLGFLFGRKGQ